MRLRSHGYEAELEFESCGFTVCMLLQLMLRGGSVSGNSIVFALTVPISSTSHRDPGFILSCDTDLLGSSPHQLMHSLCLWVPKGSRGYQLQGP